jgi:hypothetical protein
MKKIFLPILGIALAFSFTGKKDLPHNIAASITAKYPDAKIKSWEMTGDQYKVKFTADRNKEISYFSTNGDWLRTEKHVALTKDLPPAVKRGFEHSGYATWYIDGINEVTAPGQVVRYVLHVDDSDLLDSDHIEVFKTDYLLYFDREGGLIKRANA